MIKSSQILNKMRVLTLLLIMIVSAYSSFNGKTQNKANYTTKKRIYRVPLTKQDSLKQVIEIKTRQIIRAVDTVKKQQKLIENAKKSNRVDD